MASSTTSPPVLFLLFFMLFTTEATAKKNHSSVIQLGSWLSPEGKRTSWLSSSGHFAFGFYSQQGNNDFAVGIWLVSPSKNPTTTVVWTNRDSPSVSFNNSILNLTMQGLLLRNRNEKNSPHYIVSRDSDSKPVASASMHDSGNFVLYDKHFNVLWQSFDHPTDTILGGQNLTSDDELVSSMSESDHSSGRFYLSMQTDGNLVAYPMNSPAKPEDAYWATETFGADSQQLSLNVEGSLCVDNLRCFKDNNNNNNNNGSSNKSPNTTSIYRIVTEFATPPFEPRIGSCVPVRGTFSNRFPKIPVEFGVSGEPDWIFVTLTRNRKKKREKRRGKMKQKCHRFQLKSSAAAAIGYPMKCIVD